MPKYGKIARLPRNTRDELNRRIDNGEMGVRLVEWLNSLPEVKKVLETDFEGREISEQNLTEWKANGYLAWQTQQDARARARELKVNAAELAAESGGELTHSLAILIAAHYAAALDGWNGQMTEEMRHTLRGLKAISREVTRLRHSDQVVERMKIQREWLALGSKASDLNQRRYEDAKQMHEDSDFDKAFKFCAEQAKEAPEARELFMQAFEALDKAQEADHSPGSEFARTFVQLNAAEREAFRDWLKSDEAREAHEQKKKEDQDNGSDAPPATQS